MSAIGSYALNIQDKKNPEKSMFPLTLHVIHVLSLFHTIQEKTDVTMHSLSRNDGLETKQKSLCYVLV